MIHKTEQCRRVVVTGLGMITSIGTGIDAYWDNLINGISGISKVTRFDTTDYPCKVASEVSNFNATNYMDPKEAKRNDRFTQFAVAASSLALKDAGVDHSKLEASRFGAIIGSGIGGMETIGEQSKRLFNQGPRKVSPFMIPSLISNMASGMVAIQFNAKGPNYCPVSACASSSHAIGNAMHLIRYGEADVMLAGGSEAAITNLGFAGFCAMKAMATAFNDTPEKSCCPFDKKRDGFVMGEGAGVLFLESLEHAQARGATIYCEISGYGASCDAYHITSPDPEGVGLANCFTYALKDAGVKPEQVDYINAHGTSTPYNDKFETLAIKKVFGEHARKLMVSSTKSMTGHLLGAAGGIEAAATAMSIKTGIVPPTINYEDPDPDCDLDYVPNESRTAKVDVAISDNLGFGGHNAALVFKRLKL